MQSGDKTSLPAVPPAPGARGRCHTAGPCDLPQGEKDVHAIESLGEVATTAPQGADNFAKVDVSPLQGRPGRRRGRPRRRRREVGRRSPGTG